MTDEVVTQIPRVLRRAMFIADYFLSERGISASVRPKGRGLEVDVYGLELAHQPDRTVIVGHAEEPDLLDRAMQALRNNKVPSLLKGLTLEIFMRQIPPTRSYASGQVLHRYELDNV